MVSEERKKNVADDFLLCNRCGACKAVCPVAGAVGEEWASARGKVELAESFFRGEKLSDEDLRAAFDLCLHCMACEDNCPSGMRAEEVILAARVEMARRGKIPLMKRIALRMLDGMDSILFRMMRMLGLSRKGPPHGTGGKSPLSVFYPLLGWPRQRFIPLPKNKPFLKKGSEFFPASFFDEIMLDPARFTGKVYGDAVFDQAGASELIKLVLGARMKNRAERRRVYFFVGHTVNQFFPEEAEAIVLVLNILGIDVHAPASQACCGAPQFYSGDIEAARRTAAKTVEQISRVEFDWVVTSCSSGGRMLKHEFPRLFDLNEDGFFDIAWDPDSEVFTRKGEGSSAREEYLETGELYRKHIEARIFDINELIVGLLGLEKSVRGFDSMIMKMDEAQKEAVHEEPGDAAVDPRPTVTYHHPCHLNRGQRVDWQPEMILEKLPGWKYVRMKDADVCCGGGGTFTFTHPDESEKIARRKMDAIEEARPGVVATACPLCRIQLMDMMKRRFAVEAKEKGLPAREIPVVSPVELLAGDLLKILK
jgi:glycolate oxidase iron-sulfur subunit